MTDLFDSQHTMADKIFASVWLNTSDIYIMTDLFNRQHTIADKSLHEL